MSEEYRRAADWLESQTRSGRPRGPQRARELLRALGLKTPETRFVHVVGTNGKGSVAAYLEAAFEHAARGGAFLSPHLVSLRERVRCSGELVSEDEVAGYVARVRGLRLAEPPAFFDLMLGLALDCFARRGVSWAALEAGVGGASDATMAVDAGIAAVVLTNVGPDHLQTFGGCAALARDKARAARPGVPLVTAATGEALAVVRREAALVGAPLFVYDPSDPLFKLPAAPALAGGFQRENAALAAAALRLAGFSDEAVSAGLRGASLPGRMQRLVVDGVEVILDGAHNPPAALALARELAGRRFHLLFGAHERKAVLQTLEPLAAGAASVTLTWPLSGPPAGGGWRFEADPLIAFDRVRRRAAAKGEPVLVTGSLYLVGRLLSRGLGQ